MEHVVVERRMDPPIGIADLAAMDQRAAWCFEQHRVDHLTSVVAFDGVQLLCVFRAPDAEAVRSVLRRLGAAVDRVWAASLHAAPHLPASAPLAAMATPVVVVERGFGDPVDFADVHALEDRGAWCLEQHRVRFLRSYFASTRRRMVCVYEAPDAEAVRLAQRGAGLPLERAWPAMVYEVGRQAPA